MSDRKHDIMKFLQSIGLSVDDKTGELKSTDQSTGAPESGGEEESTPVAKFEYFLFYVIVTANGPVLGNTIVATNKPVTASTFNALRRSIVVEYMQDSGEKGIDVEQLTIINVTPLPKE